jgi:hypothetical protein
MVAKAGYFLLYRRKVKIWLKREDMCHKEDPGNRGV